MRDAIDPRFDYAESLSGPLPDYLLTVERQTHLKTIAPQMMSGRLQGRILALLAKLTRPHRILEIGTFTGYATLCLAEGLRPGGRIVSVEGDPEHAARARRHFAASPFAGVIDLRQAEARDCLPDLTGPFELIFLDGDKRGYPEYFPLLVERLAPAGLLIADNVLWDGKTSRKSDDEVARKLQAYNQLTATHPLLETVVLPFRDGLSICRKRE